MGGRRRKNKSKTTCGEINDKYQNILVGSGFSWDRSDYGLGCFGALIKQNLKAQALGRGVVRRE